MRAEEIRFCVDARKTGYRMGYEGDEGNMGGSDMTSGCAGGERGEFEAVDRASNSKGLRRLAVRQDAVPLVLATCGRERETEWHGEEQGEERKDNHYTRNRRHRPNFATAVPKHDPVPRTMSPSTCFTFGRNYSTLGTMLFLDSFMINSRSNLPSLYISNNIKIFFF